MLSFSKPSRMQRRLIVVSHKSGEADVQHALAAGVCADVCKDRIATELVPTVAVAIGIQPATVAAGAGVLIRVPDVPMRDADDA